jgi:hypothetical protein
MRPTFDGRKSLRATLAHARQVVRDLERVVAHRAPLDQALIDELAEGDELPTAALALRVRRREGDALAMLRRLETAGQIQRIGRRWRLVV